MTRQLHCRTCAGSVEAFADLMNERAAEFGCQNTHFVTPNGLDRSDKKGEHQTTAYDLSLIMAACIQNDKFLELRKLLQKQSAVSMEHFRQH